MSEEKTKRKIDDAGEVIAGARKDWKHFYLTAADIAQMTDEEIAINVKKDNVWPKPDYEVLVAGGMTREAAAYVKVVRDRMAQEPWDRVGGDSIQLRKSFVTMTSKVRDILMACKTADEVIGLDKRCLADLGGRMSAASYEERLTYTSIFKGRSSPLYCDYKDVRKVREMLEQGFPEKVPAWKKGLKLTKAHDGNFYVVKGRVIVESGFADEAAAWEWVKSEHENPSGKVKKEKVLPTRPHLDRLVREGMAFSLGDRNVTPDDFIEAFGFRGVQFGNWLPDDERQLVLNMGYEALMDMADVLGWEPQAMSLGGTLAVAFGARGKGGRAAAHYEPGQRIVNMTRLSGAGSLAHEFAHAFDHWAGTGTDQSVPGGIPSATGWYVVPKLRSAVLAHRGAEAASAWDKTMKDIDWSPVTKPIRIEKLQAAIEEANARLMRNQAGIDRARERSNLNTSYIKAAVKWGINETSRLRGLEAKLVEAQNADDATVFGSSASNYLQEAVKLAGSGDYWKRPTELFARAFESWVQDEIEAKGGLSQYLVYGTEGGCHPEEVYKGDPYPVGDERTRINAAMRALADVMKNDPELAAETTASLSM